jgi:hypothetical protein
LAFDRPYGRLREDRAFTREKGLRARFTDDAALAADGSAE